MAWKIFMESRRRRRLKKEDVAESEAEKLRKKVRIKRGELDPKEDPEEQEKVDLEGLIFFLKCVGVFLPEDAKSYLGREIGKRGRMDFEAVWRVCGPGDHKRVMCGNGTRTRRGQGARLGAREGSGLLVGGLAPCSPFGE